MPFCTNCGQSISFSAKFCTNCGVLVKSTSSNNLKTTNPTSTITKSSTSSSLKPVTSTNTTCSTKPTSSSSISTKKSYFESKDKEVQKEKKGKQAKEKSRIHFVFSSSPDPMTHSLTPTSSDFDFIQRDHQNTYEKPKKQKEKVCFEQSSQVKSSSSSSPSLINFKKRGDVIVSIGSPKSSSTSGIKKCKYCHQNINGNESYKMIFGNYYHDKCVHCYKCNQRIYSTSKYYNHKGKIICHPCMLNKLPKCARCNNPIKGNYVVVGNKNYHPECAPSC
ncbi:LIM zinc finger domain containing protein [Entamoeba histolytica HM-1:IMSS-B]|uniref:LIM zinc finger domain containing protein n=6 Tax=Entamoeba histolytica TaxID=5759 RepID=C4M576_ENTH1|nr:uncharacterized protein EHI_111780 [Entamoeba histolytica HM-1:IMSS]EMD45855.1 LIM zinc finger domain containing protein [Entamoeba histolytica KU27]EMH75959.1 LIM zinc finger domain containing protein [Entamoeba histolytica HM-1:IMSS-B]EMS14973.1 LIM zinc finger domain containing protein [Entamoeba histolytica HM-3:IMSS]ENY61354.1 LIM zinc finger domain containing protein [Entamoeba histolytica HM-1:IMSS-A]GAT96563.1 lim zinc finger domain containing protein [Entamoeba histolytica]|eukprot:XP_650091.1 uncharacterized protein EHI_111780 [Entamoeba histolytica HM-1:IMSS]